MTKAPFAPEKVPCPHCKQPVLAAPAGHYVWHLHAGHRCPASGQPVTPPYTEPNCPCDNKDLKPHLPGCYYYTKPKPLTAQDWMVEARKVGCANTPIPCLRVHSAQQESRTLHNDACNEITLAVLGLCERVAEDTMRTITEALCKECTAEAGPGECPIRATNNVLKKGGTAL